MDINLLWKHRIDPLQDIGSETQPVLWDDQIIFGTHHGSLISLTCDGTLNWEVKTKARKIYAQPLLLSDRLLVAGSGGEVFCVDKDGTLLWQMQLDSRNLIGIPVVDSILHELNRWLYNYKRSQRDSTFLWANPVIWNNKVALFCRGKGLTVLNPANGRIEKEFFLGFPSNHQSTPFVDDEQNLYLASQKFFVTCLRKDGTVSWRHMSFMRDDFLGGLLVLGDVLLVSSYKSKDSGRILALDKRTGAKKWEITLPSGFRGAAVKLDENRFVIHGSSGTLYGFDCQTGTLFMKIKGYNVHGFGQWSTPLVQNGFIFVPYLRDRKSGGMAIFTSKGTKIADIEAGKCLGTPLLTSEMTLYFGSWDGNLYSYNLRNLIENSSCF